MDNKTKVQLTKMRSLMERVDKNQTFNQAMINEERMINEAVNPDAVQVSRDEFLDLLAQHKEEADTKIFSFIYAKPEKIYGTKQNWRTDDVSSELEKYSDRSEKTWHQELTKFNDPALEGRKAKMPFTGILAIQKYYLSMAGYSKYGERYKPYAEELRQLRMRYGGGLNSDGMLGDSNNQREKTDWGVNINQNGKASIDIDLSARVREGDRKFFLVNADGSIDTNEEIPESVVNSIKAPKKPFDVMNGVEKGMKEVIQDPEVLMAYAKARNELSKKFNGKTFLAEGILAMVASIDGKHYYYLNDAVQASVKDVVINPSDILKIGENEIGATFEVIDGFAN